MKLKLLLVASFALLSAAPSVFAQQAKILKCGGPGAADVIPADLREKFWNDKTGEERVAIAKHLGLSVYERRSTKIMNKDGTHRLLSYVIKTDNGACVAAMTTYDME